MKKVLLFCCSLMIGVFIGWGVRSIYSHILIDGDSRDNLAGEIPLLTDSDGHIYIFDHSRYTQYQSYGALKDGRVEVESSYKYVLGFSVAEKGMSTLRMNNEIYYMLYARNGKYILLCHGKLLSLKAINSTVGKIQGKYLYKEEEFFFDDDVIHLKSEERKVNYLGQNIFSTEGELISDYPLYQYWYDDFGNLYLQELDIKDGRILVLEKTGGY